MRVVQHPEILSFMPAGYLFSDGTSVTGANNKFTLEHQCRVDARYQ
ncbi:MAG: hypothetical protein GPOALKHO_000387 [Sodalis sp.]|nr:MAG: hypothetical protein GPOALKHO_000387 [Sodalis sp.]